MSFVSKITTYTTATWLLSAAVVLAAETPTDFKSFVDLVVGLIEILVAILIGLAVLYFMWNVIKSWIIKGDDAQEIAEGRRFVLMGIIGLVVMVGIWGIINILKATFFG